MSRLWSRALFIRAFANLLQAMRASVVFARGLGVERRRRCRAVIAIVDPEALDGWFDGWVDKKSTTAVDAGAAKSSNGE